MAKTSDPPPIDDATIEMLESQVKKGKARKFFMIYKGASIKTLVVFKKGPFGPKIMRAKKDGFKGEVVYGVVTGSGQNLFFQIPATDAVAAAMKVDSWEEKPPTKKSKLRAFLNDSGLKFKPSLFLIRDLGSVPDPDTEVDYSAAPTAPEAADDQTEESDAAPVAEEPTLESEATPQQESSRFLSRLKAIKPDLDKVVSAQVSVSAEARLRAGEAGTLARSKQFFEANQVMDTVEELVAQGLAELAEEPAANDNAAALFKKRLIELLPQIKQAAGTAAGNHAKALAGDASKLAKAKQFDEANVALDEIEALLDKAGSEATDSAARFKQRLATLVPQIKQAMGTAPGDQAKLRASEAAALARKKELGQAHALLDEVESLLRSGAAKGEPTAADDLVTLWRDAKESTDVGIETLRKHLTQYDEPNLARIAEMGLNGVTEGNQTRMMAALMEFRMASGDRRTKAAQALADTGWTVP